MLEIKLSDRLKMVASFVPAGSKFADIGSDHAYLPCYVCLLDEEASSIAGEVNEGPYQSALQTIGKYNLHDRVEARLGNGLSVLKPDEVDTVVIAGMGGSLIQTILEEGKEKLEKVSTIITQANINSKVLRKWFIDNHYMLAAEEIMEENGHMYEILVAKAPAAEEVNPYHVEAFDKELLFGPFLMKEKSPAFIKKWKDEKKKKSVVIENMRKAANVDPNKLQQFEQEYRWMEEVTKDGEK